LSKIGVKVPFLERVGVVFARRRSHWKGSLWCGYSGFVRDPSGWWAAAQNTSPQFDESEKAS
jgi:hypothetical protein